MKSGLIALKNYTDSTDDNQSDSGSDSDGSENTAQILLQLIHLTCCILRPHAQPGMETTTFEDMLTMTSTELQGDATFPGLGSGLFVVDTVTNDGHKAYYGLCGRVGKHAFLYLPDENKFHLVGNKGVAITKSKNDDQVLLDFIEECALECVSQKEPTSLDSIPSTINLPVCICTDEQYTSLFKKLLSGIPEEKLKDCVSPSMPELAYEKQGNVPFYKSKLTGHMFGVDMLPESCKYYDTVARTMEVIKQSKDKKCVLLECPTRFMAPPLSRRLLKMLQEETNQSEELQVILTDVPYNLQCYCHCYIVDSQMK